MKYPMLLLSFMFSVQLIFAQQKMSCCHLSAPQEFAMLPNNENFKASHLNPEPFVYSEDLGKLMEFTAADGKQARAFVILSPEKTHNFLLVIHEWWGLNDYMKQVSAKLYKDLGNVNVMAVDLYDGKVASNREEAAEYMKEADEDRIKAILQGAINWVGNDADIATIGWCFGGGWSLQTALMAGDQAAGCVMYYGMPEKDVDKLKTLKADVMAIFAAKDDWINQDVVKKFDENMQKAGKQLSYETYEADHAFANPSNPSYNKEAADSAYVHTLSFLKDSFK